MDKYDYLLLKARKEMVKKPLREAMESQTIFNAVWSNIVEKAWDDDAATRYNKLMAQHDEKRNAAREQNRVAQEQKETQRQERKDNRAAASEKRRQGLKDLAGAVKSGAKSGYGRVGGGLVSGAKKVGRGAVRGVKAAGKAAGKGLGNVKNRLSELSEQRQEKRQDPTIRNNLLQEQKDYPALRDMAQSVASTPPSLQPKHPVVDSKSTVAAELAERQERRRKRLDTERKSTTQSPPGLSNNQEKKEGSFWDKLREPKVTLTGKRPEVGHGSAKAENEWKKKQQKLVEEEIDTWPMPPAQESAPKPEPPVATPPAATPPAATPPAGQQTLKIGWDPQTDPIKSIEMASIDDYSLLPKGMLKQQDTPQMTDVDYSLLPLGWNQGE